MNPICQDHDVYLLKTEDPPPHNWVCRLCHKEFIAYLDNQYNTQCWACFEAICDAHVDVDVRADGVVIECTCPDPMGMHWMAQSNCEPV